MQHLLRRTVVMLVVCLFGCREGTGGGTFTVMQGEREGHPLFAMIDTSRRDSKLQAGFPWFLSIKTTLTAPTKDGLPTDQEATALNDWEDALEKELSGACQFVYVGRVTWNGTRELLYYVDKPDTVVPRLGKLAGGHPVRPFRIQHERDAQWTKVSMYLSAH